LGTQVATRDPRTLDEPHAAVESLRSLPDLELAKQGDWSDY
jgi:hypothetical protein